MEVISVDQFLAIKEGLRYCPKCGQRLSHHPINRAIRVCSNHGDVFLIYHTVSGYRVEMNLAIG